MRPIESPQAEVARRIAEQSNKVLVGFFDDGTEESRAKATEARSVFLYAALRGIDLLDARLKKDQRLTVSERNRLVAILEKHRSHICLFEDAHLSAADIAAVFALASTGPIKRKGSRARRL